jgi:hypothetical protein
MPYEVAWYAAVWHLATGFGVGSETIKRMGEIEDKYPEWFPWEHKYKSIPKEVHESYELEKSGPDIKIDYSDAPKKGWVDMLESAITVPLEFNLKSFEEMMAEHYKNKEKEHLLKKEQRKKDKALWDKHYKKYGLKFRK